MTGASGQFERALLDLDRLGAKAVLDAAGGGMTPFQVAGAIIVPVLERIGVGWQEGRVALSQVYMAGRICEQLVDQLIPQESGTRIHQPRIAITTLNDHHSLGRRIVYSHLRSAGFDLVDYGRTEVDELVARVLRDRVEVLMISTLMIFSALMVRGVKDRLSAAGAVTRILVGGAPFNFDDQLWQTVGADAMGRDGAEAVAYVSREERGAS